jgi:hypothetical protein
MKWLDEEWWRSFTMGNGQGSIVGCWQRKCHKYTQSKHCQQLRNKRKNSITWAYFSIRSSTCTWGIFMQNLANKRNLSLWAHHMGVRWPIYGARSPSKLAWSMSKGSKAIWHHWINLCFFLMVHIHFTRIHGPTFNENWRDNQIPSIKRTLWWVGHASRRWREVLPIIEGLADPLWSVGRPTMWAQGPPPTSSMPPCTLMIFTLDVMAVWSKSHGEVAHRSLKWCWSSHYSTSNYKRRLIPPSQLMLSSSSEVV